MNKAFLNIALGMLLILYFGFSWGFIVYKYWHWFLLEVFPELPKITFLAAVGLKMFMGILGNTLSTRSLKEDFYIKSSIEYAGEMVLKPWLVLFAGWVIYEFINIV